MWFPLVFVHFDKVKYQLYTLITMHFHLKIIVTTIITITQSVKFIKWGLGRIKYTQTLSQPRRDRGIVFERPST